MKINELSQNFVEYFVFIRIKKYQVFSSILGCYANCWLFHCKIYFSKRIKKANLIFDLFMFINKHTLDTLRIQFSGSVSLQGFFPLHVVFAYSWPLLLKCDLIIYPLRSYFLTLKLTNDLNTTFKACIKVCFVLFLFTSKTYL